MVGIIDRLLGNTTVSQEQQKVHCGEIFKLWHHLTMRYDIRELTDIFQNFANDIEFKAILSLGLNTLNNEITQLENEMNRFGIPLPPRPPKSINTPGNTEILRDELMFRTIYMGIQNFLGELSSSILVMQNDNLQDMFIKMQEDEISIYTKMSAYGKLKGWLFIPPSYNVNQ